MNAVKHLKDPYDNIREQISYNSFFPEMFSDIGNRDAKSSNLWITAITEYGKSLLSQNLFLEN